MNDHIYALVGRAVLPGGEEPDGAVVVRNGTIVYAGPRRSASLPENIMETDGCIIAPGFVDIHCHAGGAFLGYDDPAAMAAHHLRHGTTGLLCTFYRDLGHEKTLRAIEGVKNAMKTSLNLLGVHLEGPYLNPAYGSKAGFSTPVSREKYEQYAASGIIRQWTFAPEVEGTDTFLADITSWGIVPAIGHSAASPEQVYAAACGGARIVTHLMDATGYSISPARYGGTQELSFDHAALLCDNLYYEIICDRNGVHVRHDMIRLILKTVGAEKIIGITDATTEDSSDTDVNFLDGELTGSKLTMDQVARNFLSLGLSLHEVFQITAANPAKAIGMEHRIGSLAPGRAADILLIDTNGFVKKVIKNGEAVI